VSNPVNKHLPQIDALRALAVVAVMVFHLDPNWLPGGFTGVDVFFVISGYVVSASLSQSPPLRLSHFVARFYARRMLRILPALLVCMLVTVLLMAMFVPESWLSGANKETVLLGFAGLSNFSLMAATDGYFSPRTEFNMATHTWSLGVEEQFYFVFPLLFFAWARSQASAQSGWRRAAHEWCLPVLLLLSAALATWASAKSPLLAYYSLPTRFWELAAGALLFRGHARQFFYASKLSKPLLLWVGLIAIAVGLVAADKAAFPMPWALLPVLGTLAVIDVIVLGAQGNGHSMQGAAWRAVVWIGKASYSLYLWHWPVYTVFRWTVGLDTTLARVVALGLVVAVAAGSYHWIENPLRRNARFLALANWKTVVLGLLSTAIFAGLGLVGLTIAKPVLGLSVTENKRDWYAMDWYVDKAAKSGACRVQRRDSALQGMQLIEFKAADCGPVATPRTLFVIGDSHAAAYSTNLSHLAKDEPAVTVRVYLRAGCAFLNLMTPAEQAAAHCADFARNVKAEITRLAKPGDVVFLPSLRLRRFADQFVVFDTAVANEKMSGAAAQVARAKAVEEADVWLTELSETGAKILFEAPAPIFKAPAFRCSDWFNRSNPICAAGLSVTRDELLAYRQPVMQGMESLVQKLPQVAIWDPFPVLCPDAVCQVTKEGRPLYFDADHLSGYGNDVLYPNFKHAVDARWADAAYQRQ